MSIGQETRRESHAKVDKTKRRAEITAVLWRAGEPMTAREISRALGYYERNATQPRLNEMKRDGVVVELGKKYDALTDRRVTAYWLAKRKAPDGLPSDKGARKNTASTEYHGKGGMSNE